MFADDLCVIRSLHTDIVEHFQAVLAMHTGSATVPLPSLGAWLSYGLGTFNTSLPSYMVLCEHMPYAGSQVWDSNFLPPIHQGVRIVPGADPIPDLRGEPQSVSLQELELLMLREANERHAAKHPGNADLRARIATFDVARGMMQEAPEVLDAGRETRATLASYGVAAGDKTSFGYQCLIARRLIERGVRVVELIDTGSNNNWDAHGNMQDHRPKALRVDRAIAALFCGSEGKRALRFDLDRDLHRVWPDAVDGLDRNARSQPLCQGVHRLARRRRRQRGLCLWADR